LWVVDMVSPETVQTAAIIAASGYGIGTIIAKLFAGLATWRRAKDEGQALLIRAERGDPEPPMIVLPPRLKSAQSRER
jgi:hypothetical protein